MSFHAPAPTTIALFGNGTALDGSDSTVLGKLEKVGTSVVFSNLAGMGSGNITLTDPAAVKATLVSLASRVAANQGFDAVDLYNVVGSSADPKVGLNEETAIVSVSGPTPVLTFPAALYADFIGAFGDLGY